MLHIFNISNSSYIIPNETILVKDYIEIATLPEEYSSKETYLGEQVIKLHTVHIFDTNGKELDTNTLFKNNKYIIIYGIKRTLWLIKKYDPKVTLPNLTDLKLGNVEYVECLPDFLHKLQILKEYTHKIPPINNNLQELYINGTCCKFLNTVVFPNNLKLLTTRQGTNPRRVCG